MKPRAAIGWQLWLCLLLGCGGVGLLLAPTERIQDGPRPGIGLEATVFLLDGASLRQTVNFETPVAEQVGFRVWGLLEPSAAPYLTLRCEHAGRVIAEVSAKLPPVDGAYHALDGPWCDLAGQRSAVLTVTGHGVRMMTSAVDRIPGELTQNGTSLPNADLVLQLRQRQAGIDRYLPISRWAADKPGILGWKQLYVLLPYVYLLLILVLVQSAARWRARS